MTALVINRKTLGFLRRIVKINFPSGHQWTANAVVTANVSISTNAPFTMAVTIVVGGTGTNGTIIISYDDHAVQTISDPSNILGGQTGNFLQFQVNKEQISANPSVSASLSLSVSLSSSGGFPQVAIFTDELTATGDTSGHPGGDFLKSDANSSPIIAALPAGPASFIATGHASANNVNATASVTNG